MNPDTEFILACLQKRCSEISIKPNKGKPCNGLVAFQDGLSFSAPNISKGLELFEVAIDAIRARFKFARRVYESQHGASETFAEEFIAVAEMTEGKDAYTGYIEVRAQIVLKSLTSTEPSLMDQINGKG